MKKTLLTLIFSACGLILFAQEAHELGQLYSAPEIQNDVLKAKEIATPSNYYNIVNASKGSGTSVVIGNSANPFTGVGVRSALQYDQDLNTILFMHRQDPAVSGVGESGWIRFAYSSDGGSTWNTDEGPLWNNSVGVNARYPQGFLVNPPGNTDVNNAHAVFMGPTLEGTNGASWGGVGYASRLIGDTGTATNQFLYNSTPGARLHYIPDGGTVVNNTVWVIDPIPDWNGGTGVYTDSLAIYKGVINGNQVDFTSERVYLPVDQNNGFPTNEAIAFSPDGQTGYITMLGRLDSTLNPFETYSLIWLKTTDGGTTWSAPGTFVISEDTVLRNQLGGDTTFQVTTGFEQDVVVDKNGNPHCIMNIGLTNTTSAYSIFGESSLMYHVWSPDGGVTWNFDSVGSTHGFRGYWGDLSNAVSEDNRPQISRDSEGEYVMMAYFDADTSLFAFTPCDPGNPPANAPCGNIDRTIKYLGYNVDKDYYTPTISDLTSTDALQFSFEFISEVSINTGTGIQIPFAYQIMTDRSNYVSPTTHKYENGMSFTYEELGDSTSSIAPQREVLEQIGLFPNPVQNVLNISFDASTKGIAQVEVLNILGQKVYTGSPAKANQGLNRVSVDTERFEEGVYILRLTVNGKSVSRKFLKE